MAGPAIPGGPSGGCGGREGSAVRVEGQAGSAALDLDPAARATGVARAAEGVVALLTLRAGDGFVLLGTRLGMGMMGGVIVGVGL